MTPSIFAHEDYGASATITRSFYLAVIYYLLRNQHSYCPWSYQATPQLARLVIGALQVLHFLISSVFSIDLLQNFSVFLLHRVIMIDKLVGPPSSKPVSPAARSVEKEEGSDRAIILTKSPSKGSKKVDKRN